MYCTIWVFSSFATAEPKSEEIEAPPPKSEPKVEPKQDTVVTSTKAGTSPKVLIADPIPVAATPAAPAAQPYEEEEEISAPPDLDSGSSSRRKGRKPEIRRTTRSSGDKAEDAEEPDSGTKEDIQPAPTVVSATTAVSSVKADQPSAPPTTTRSSPPSRKVKSPSPRKDDFGSQPEKSQPPAGSVASGASSQLLVDDDEKFQSNAKLVSRGKGNDAAEGKKKSALDGATTATEHEESWTEELNEAVQAASAAVESTGKVESAAGKAVGGAKDMEDSSDRSGGRTSPAERMTRSTRASATKSPSPLKETSSAAVVKSPPRPTVASPPPPMIAPTAAVVVAEVKPAERMEEKKAEEKTRKLTVRSIDQNDWAIAK